MKKDKILGTRPSILVLDEISTDDENAYEVLSYKPSLRERFWKKLVEEKETNESLNC